MLVKLFKLVMLFMTLFTLVMLFIDSYYIDSHAGLDGHTCQTNHAGHDDDANHNGLLVMDVLFLMLVMLDILKILVSLIMLIM